MLDNPKIWPKETAVTALTFHETDSGQLEIRVAIIRDGENSERLIDLATRIFAIVSEQLAAERTELLMGHNPGRHDA